MGDELALEQRRSTSPTHMEDYRRKDIVSESEIPVTGSEPVPLAYRHIDHTSFNQISGLVPSYGTNMITATTGAPLTTVTTATGYVNGGQSINVRPRLADPVDRSSGLAAGDVDFDQKCNEEYANIEELQRGNDYKQTSETIYRGVPNRSKEQKDKARMSCCFFSFVIFIFIFQVVILVLAVFNLVNGLEVGSITSGLVSSSSSSPSSSSTPSPQTTVDNLSNMIQELQSQLAKLEGDLARYNTTHTTNFGTFYTKLVNINETVANLSTSTPSSQESEVDIPFSPLKQNCTVKVRTCPTQTTIASNASHPNYVYCATPTIQIVETNDTYLADMYCTVDTGNQVMPIATTLSNTTQGFSCLCHGLNISSVVQTDIQPFNCHFYYKLCPTSIPVSIPLQ